MHFASRVRTWRVARLYSVQCIVQWNSCISGTVRNRTHVHIQFLLRMTGTTTSQNIDLCSWDTLYIYILGGNLTTLGAGVSQSVWRRAGRGKISFPQSFLLPFYYTTLPIYMWHWMLEWVMNWKRLSANRSTIPEFCRRDCGKSRRKDSRFPAEIRTEHLANTNLERYRYANPLGFSFV
jgi:hypothetical protein